LLDAIEGRGDVAKVEGILHREAGRIVKNPRRARRMEIDAIAPPAWQHIDLQKYHEHRYMFGIYSERLSIPILATRGCPYQCTYCSAPNMWTPRWVARSPRLVVDEIQHYVERYGARDFPFQDLTAIITKKWVVEFCQELLRRKLDITWQLPVGTRSEAIDAEVAALLKESGMISMAYAPESGSETTRRLIKKKMKRENLMKSIDAAVAADLNVTALFVIGFPHDRPEHLEETLPFLDELAERGVSDIAIGFYMALPGTELFHSLYDEGHIALDLRYFQHILSALTFVPTRSYCPALSRLQLVRWKIRMFRRFYGARGGRRQRRGLLAELYRAARGIVGSEAHQSRLETAVRNALISTQRLARVALQPRWLPVREERAMMADWDRVYRRLRAEKIAQGGAARAPADTAQLHERNVIPVLELEHGRALAFPIAADRV
jgi:radical SAM superfamily enzyme YgiQ (UPF0313 family)